MSKAISNLGQGFSAVGKLFESSDRSELVRRLMVEVVGVDLKAAAIAKLDPEMLAEAQKVLEMLASDAPRLPGALLLKEMRTALTSKPLRRLLKILERTQPATRRILTLPGLMPDKISESTWKSFAKLFEERSELQLALGRKTGRHFNWMEPEEFSKALTTKKANPDPLKLAWKDTEVAVRSNIGEILTLNDLLMEVDILAKQLAGKVEYVCLFTNVRMTFKGPLPLKNSTNYIRRKKEFSDSVIVIKLLSGGHRFVKVAETKTGSGGVKEALEQNSAILEGRTDMIIHVSKSAPRYGPGGKLMNRDAVFAALGRKRTNTRVKDKELLAIDCRVIGPADSKTLGAGIQSSPKKIYVPADQMPKTPAEAVIADGVTASKSVTISPLKVGDHELTYEDLRMLTALVLLQDIIKAAR